MTVKISVSKGTQFFVVPTHLIQFSVFISHVIKTKNRNHSMKKVKNLGYDR